MSFCRSTDIAPYNVTSQVDKISQSILITKYELPGTYHDVSNASSLEFPRSSYVNHHDMSHLASCQVALII